MTNVPNEIKDIAWLANRRLSTAIENLAKARADLATEQQAQSFAIIALAAIHGDEDVIRRGHELEVAALRALNPVEETNP